MTNPKSRLRWKERVQKLKRKVWNPSPSSPESTEQDICGEKSEVPTLPVSELSVITSLSELPLPVFIKCSAHEQYDGIVIEKKPEYSEVEQAQIKGAWHRLLSQYYEAKEDKYAAHYLKTVMELEAIKFRARWVDFICGCISELYTDGFAAILREEYQRFKFSKESYQQDLKGVYNIEKASKIKYDNLTAELTRIEKNRDTTTRTPEQKEYAFYDSIIGINSVLKSSYRADELNTLQYARLMREAERQVEQSKKR